MTEGLFCSLLIQSSKKEMLSTCVHGWKKDQQCVCVCGEIMSWGSTSVAVSKDRRKEIDLDAFRFFFKQL